MRAADLEPASDQPTAEVGEGVDTDRALIDRLAQRLHDLRNSRHLTLEQLSRTSGVSRAMLWQVEQGRSVPTIKVLSRVAEALGLPVSAFLDSDQRSTATLLRARDARRLTSADGLSVSRALFPYAGVHDVEFYELRLGVGAIDRADPHPPGTHENLVVAQGRVQIDVAGQVHRLNIGDALYFGADVAHVYRNIGDDVAVLYLVVSHPGRLNYG